MLITPIKTRRILPPKDDLLGAIADALPRIADESVVVVTSKVVSIWQGQCVPREAYPDKDALIKKEADYYLPRDVVPNKWCVHTLKNNVFIPNAGIDESNANGYYILWPRNPKYVAKRLWGWLRNQYGVKRVGVILCDSHTIPLRRGVVGISLAHYGFAPLYDYRGKRDLFGRPFEMSQTNIPDGVAAAAVVAMGEGAECTPLAVIENVPRIRFVSKPVEMKKAGASFEMKTKDDLYYPLLSSVPWEKGGRGVPRKERPDV